MDKEVKTTLIEERNIAEVEQASAPQIGRHVPSLIASLGTKEKKRFTTFFTDNIRNRNTREA